jgi:anaerobic selenocysteine-containing dehydrogenase
MIIIETIRGMTYMKAAVTKDIHPKVVSVPYNFGGLANANNLTSYRIYTPELGMPTYRALLCRVKKATLGEPQKVVAG